MIKLYTKTVCPKCILVKTVLTRANLEYEAINIDTDEDAKNKIVEAGFMSVPILEVDSELIGDMSAIQKAISELA